MEIRVRRNAQSGRDKGEPRVCGQQRKKGVVSENASKERGLRLKMCLAHPTQVDNSINEAAVASGLSEVNRCWTRLTLCHIKPGESTETRH